MSLLTTIAVIHTRKYYLYQTIRVTVVHINKRKHYHAELAAFFTKYNTLLRSLAIIEYIDKYPVISRVSKKI